MQPAAHARADGRRDAAADPNPHRRGAAPAPAQPDLVPTDFVNFRTCNTTSFGTCVPNPNDCNGAFTGQRKFTQADLQYGVRNISAVAITTPFAVVLRRNGAQLARNVVPTLDANATATFTFHRANSNVCVEQIGPNKVCTYCAVAIDDAGIEVVVDSNNAIAEVADEQQPQGPVPGDRTSQLTGSSSSVQRRVVRSAGAAQAPRRRTTRDPARGPSARRDRPRARAGSSWAP